MKKYKEKQLVKRIENGDHQAFQELLEPITPIAKALIYRYVGKSDVDDVFQDTALKAWIFITDGKFKSENKFNHWFMVITKNECLDLIRARKKKPIPVESFFGTSFQSGGAPDTRIIQKEDDEYWEYVLSRLNKTQQTALRGRIEDGLPFQEIAEKTGINSNTLRTSVHNARKKIRHILNADHSLIYSLAT